MIESKTEFSSTFMFQDIRTMYPDTEDDKTQDQSLPSGISWSSSSTTNNANINPDIEIISADAETVKNTPTNVIIKKIQRIRIKHCFKDCLQESC